MGVEYEVRVAGLPTRSWVDWFPGIRARDAVQPDGTACTVLRVPGGDVSLLHGVLAQIGALNLCQLSARKVERKKEMKVVGVIGSPHRDGNGATLVREALGAARAAGAEVAEVFLPDQRIESCRACGTCLRTGACPIPDDFQRVKDLLREADGIILSTPTYGAAPGARIKNLMDRLGQLAFLTSFLGQKYLAAIVTAGSFGHKATVAQLTAAARGSVFQRARVSGTLAVTLRGRQAGEVPGALGRARRLGRALAEDIRRRRAYPLQGLGVRLMNRLLMRPMMGQAIARNREQGLQAVYANLVERGLLRL
jgi:multimeric flavodoxin WrbA